MKALLLIWLVAGGLSYAAAEESLGRLFSSPAERAALDQIRQTKREMIPQVEVNQEPEASLSVPVAVAPVMMQGYVKRSDGKDATVWINNQAITENASNQEIVVGKVPAYSNKIPIHIRANGKWVALKPGQQYDPETGSIREKQASVGHETGRIGNEAP